MKTINQFIKFIVIGGVGMLVNTGLTYIGVQYIGLWYLWSFCISALIGWTVIFIGNAFFTFPEHERHSYIKKYITFLFGYLMVFSVNVSLVFVFTSLFLVHYLASIILSTIITTLATFTFNKNVIFN